MKKASILWAAAFAVAWSAASAFGQQRVIQPSPAYYQNSGATYVQPAPAVPPAPVAVPAVPAAVAVPEAAPPVDNPSPRQMTLAPAPAYEEEDEEGLYWFWGQKWPGLALGPKFGTTGIGLDVVFGINPYVNLRGGFNYGSFTWNSSLGDVDYDMDVNMTSVPIVVDIHPFANHFRITGGLYIQSSSSADINATPGTPVQIGEHIYPPEVVGTLSGKIEVTDTLTPYLGIGFGNAVDEEQLLTFMVDFGVIFQTYDVTLTSNGAGMETPIDTFRVDLAKEQQNVRDDLDSLKIYPVLTFGIAYHF
jgi:hypothetical protein